MAPLKVGIIGVGRIGRCHCASIASVPTKAKITMICDIYEPALLEVQGMYNIEHITKDPMELIKSADVEAVIICSPTDQHADQIIACAEAGKYIFAEKPISLALDIIDRVDAKVKETNALCFVAFQRRFDPHFMRLKKAVTDGEAGDIRTVHITSRDPNPPPVAYVKVSGGLHNDMAVHDFDMARHIIGSEVEEVYCKGSCKVNPEIGEAGDIDTSLVMLTFENGVVATVDNCRQASYGYDQRVEVFGSKGMVQLNNAYGNNCVVSNSAAVQRDLPFSFFMDRYADAYRNEMIAFVDVCASADKKSPVGVSDGRAAYLIGKAAKQSMETGKPVKISEVC
ncbi:inositol 2-dehydrogenase [Tribonema minus]|uniref:Inositol 2-dehydrogenase n=1 Tax=Tribonema minus TaxID=303371 RepID=A0A836CCZ1_9STRA|nr:inositol 2-dehydrogenase [Tribonema minus]|eukprot:TRINITY_DN4106_c0_g1_i1.p1 TRINITY_DN4106_c0_g1~~TRINITY_DN4106_c0_g1_i1.p1  ORF type:complete len:339 (+),score=150.83 TRINITY_DN4106_c0_g1_i1:63-1079(+)